MTALNKQALREAAQEEIMLRSISDTSDSWQDEASPEAVLALLNELEVSQKLATQQGNIAVELFDEVTRLQRSADDKAPELREQLESAEKRISELEARAFNPAILDVVAERQRQVSAEGWTPAHDDQHRNNDMAFAAACYAFHAAAASWDLEDGGVPYDSHPVPKNWPWEPDWWKPTDPRRDLVKAGALIIAEIERIDRAAGIGVKGE